MDQPKIIQRVQEWWRRRPSPRPSVALHLVNLQERFGPSSLSGLADTAALFSITAPVAHCETVTSHEQQTQVTPVTPPVSELGELPSMVRTLVPESLPPPTNPITLANLSSELDWNIGTPTSPYNVADVPNTPEVCATTGANDTPATPTVPAMSTPNVAVSVATTRSEVPALSLAKAAPTSETPTETPPTLTDKQLVLEPTPDVGPVAEEAALDVTQDAEQEWVFPEIDIPADDLPAEDWTAYPDVGEAGESGQASLEQVFQDELGPNTNKADGEIPTTTVTVGPQVRLEASADSAPAPKVTASATPKSDALRLSRPTADSTPLAVNYQLAAFAGTAVVQQTGTAVIPAGAKHVDVPAHGHGLEQRAEVVTLRVQPGQGYDATPTTATQFLNTEGQPLGDAALFAAYRHSGSQAAFREIVARHQMSVFRVAYQVLGNRADAEDVSQLAFLVLARQDMTIHSSLHYWLQKVTRNASIALLRAKSRRLRYESELAKLAESPSPEESYAMADEVQVALAGLPAPLSEAVRLRYLEGWSQQEAAAIVGVPRGTLSQRASQGLQTLRETMLDEQREAG